MWGSNSIVLFREEISLLRKSFLPRNEPSVVRMNSMTALSKTTPFRDQNT